MIWEKDRQYTYADVEEWTRDGYRGMELLEGVPYQYGVSVFEQRPMRFPPSTINKILENFYRQFSISLKDRPYQIKRSYPVSLGDRVETPDIMVCNHNQEPAVLVDIAQSEKQETLSRCMSTGIHCWWIYPDSQTIIVYSPRDGKVYGRGTEIPIADSGCTFPVENLWELPELG